MYAEPVRLSAISPSMSQPVLCPAAGAPAHTDGPRLPSNKRPLYRHSRAERGCDLQRSMAYIFTVMWRIAVLVSWRLPGEGPIDGGAGDREEFRQIADGVLAGRVHPPQLF